MSESRKDSVYLAKLAEQYEGGRASCIPFHEANETSQKWSRIWSMLPHYLELTVHWRNFLCRLQERRWCPLHVVETGAIMLMYVFRVKSLLVRMTALIHACSPITIVPSQPTNSGEQIICE